MDYEKIKKYLDNHGQQHILQFYNDLNDEEKNYLLKQISSIDVSVTNGIYNHLITNALINAEKRKNTKYKINPLTHYNKDDIDVKKCLESGLKDIKNGEVALITLAGGLGTRLEHSGPKGTFELTIANRNISLFELIINKLKGINKKYQIETFWYIMCSKENILDTKNYFFNHNYFEYPKERIIFFAQDELPIYLDNGRIALKSKSEIYMGSQGNGNLYRALKENNLISHMDKNRIKWLFVSGIDNVLLKPIDPIFLGLTKITNNLVGAKSITKKDGILTGYVFCKKDDKVYMLENSKITQELNDYKENNRYLYRETNIVSYVINLLKIKEYSTMELPFHDNYRKIKCIDEKGAMIIPNTNNSYKFEQHIFEAFYKEKEILIYSVNNDEFSPLKNLNGEESVETAIKDYLKYNEKGQD